MDNLGNFEIKSNEDIFLGYYTSSKYFRIINKITLSIEESLYVIFDENNLKLVELEVFDCACILNITFLEDIDKDKYKDKVEDKGQDQR